MTRSALDCAIMLGVIAGADERDPTAVPLPVPDAPFTIVSQDAFFEAVQAHPFGAVTVTLPFPPGAATAICRGVTPNEHWTTAAACVIVTACPATVTVSVRALVAVFTLAATVTVPLPVPDAPFTIVSQDAFVEAVQAHPFGAVTATRPLPPEAATPTSSGATLNAHGMVAAAWVMVTACPATVAVVERPAPSLAATDSCTVPDPVVVCAVATTIHEAGTLACQIQADVVVTRMVSVPPSAGTDAVVGDTAKVHGGPDVAACATVTVCPATITMPVRAPPGLAANDSATAPGPAPAGPPVTVIQVAFDVASHTQLAVVATTMGAVPPSAGTEVVRGVTWKTQVGSTAAACLTVTV